MKIEGLIFVVVFAGILTLFFFPEPESNFIWYVLTWFCFGVLVGVLAWLKVKGKLYQKD